MRATARVTTALLTWGSTRSTGLAPAMVSVHGGRVTQRRRFVIRFPCGRPDPYSRLSGLSRLPGSRRRTAPASRDALGGGTARDRAGGAGHCPRGAGAGTRSAAQPQQRLLQLLPSPLFRPALGTQAGPSQAFWPQAWGARRSSGPPAAGGGSGAGRRAPRIPPPAMRALPCFLSLRPPAGGKGVGAPGLRVAGGAAAR